jgi:hypothetical protein
MEIRKTNSNSDPLEDYDDDFILYFKSNGLFSEKISKLPILQDGKNTSN